MRVCGSPKLTANDGVGTIDRFGAIDYRTFYCILYHFILVRCVFRSLLLKDNRKYVRVVTAEKKTCPEISAIGIPAWCYHLQDGSSENIQEYVSCLYVFVYYNLKIITCKSNKLYFRSYLKKISKNTKFNLFDFIRILLTCSRQF